MTFKTIAIALTAIALPLAASAQSAGHIQLARSLGVDPGAYTIAQLSKVAAYASDENSAARQQIAFILGNDAKSGDVIFSARSAEKGSIFPQDFGTSKPYSLNN